MVYLYTLELPTNICMFLANIDWHVQAFDNTDQDLGISCANRLIGNGWINWCFC